MIKGKAKIMDKIYLNDLEFYAYHGVFDLKKKKGKLSLSPWFWKWIWRLRAPLTI